MLEGEISNTFPVDIQQRLNGLASANQRLQAERDEYKKQYLAMLELCKKLERGILGQKRERFLDGSQQLTMSLLETLMGNTSNAEAILPAPVKQEVAPHTRHKPTGRKPLPETLPRVDIEILPPEVQEKGLDAFYRIGEDVSQTVERRPSSLVVVRVHKPKFVLKGQDRLSETKVLQAASPDLPIPGGLAGPNLLADTIVRRWADHLPLHRLERIYSREGLELARSTLCGWHEQLSVLVNPLVEAMWADALTASYLCADATGVLVQAANECRRGHFWVVAAPERHVLFGYSPRHDSAAVDKMLKDYKGTLLVDAHAVYNHLFQQGDVVEAGCWSHARRYFFKALNSDPDRAKHALHLIGALFEIEKACATSPPEVRKNIRLEKSKPILDAFFSWCDQQSILVLDETPIAKAVGYARNQRKALQRFLEDGRLPIHNNFSELQLRREAVGRKNWLFIGNDDAGQVNANFVSLLASCQLHRIEPLGYLRDLFCLLPDWNQKRVLELSPVNWNQTLQQPDAQQSLASNPFRKISLAVPSDHTSKNNTPHP